MDMEKAEFKDESGNNWEIRLTVGLLEELKDRQQLDVLSEKQGDEITPLSKILWDTQRLSEVLWSCIRKAAEARGIKKDEWRESLSVDELTDGWNALRQAVVNFYRRRNPKMGEAIEAMYQAEVEVMDRSAEQIAKTLTSDASKQMIEDAMSSFDKKLESVLAEGLERAGGR